MWSAFRNRQSHTVYIFAWKQFTWRQENYYHIISQKYPINKKLWYFTRAGNSCTRGWWNGWCHSSFNWLSRKSCTFWFGSATNLFWCKNGQLCAQWWQKSGNRTPKQLQEGDRKEHWEWKQKDPFQAMQVGIFVYFIVTKIVQLNSGILFFYPTKGGSIRGAHKNKHLKQR